MKQLLCATLLLAFTSLYVSAGIVSSNKPVARHAKNSLHGQLKRHPAPNALQPVAHQHVN